MKILVREVLSDRYRITQEQFKYQGVEICMTFRKGYIPKTSCIFPLLGTGISLVLFYIYPILPHAPVSSHSFLLLVTVVKGKD